MDRRNLVSGLVRLHLLPHAAREEIFGPGILEELRRHGDRLGAGTPYPILHGLQRQGFLRSVRRQVGPRFRRVSRATPLGRRALRDAEVKVREWFGERFEDDGRSSI